LTFQEGALVQAVRRGYWVVLDELNLAPSDVLEALNRLLDDNRELFVPELQETIRPHPHFVLFATQNPPGAIYGGRKVLSKAFRNRFVELHIGDIPDEELKVILNKRCEIAPSYCVKLVESMRALQGMRRGSRAFAGKDGYITARDLFRWANRKSVGYENLASDGFRVLGERLRSENERMSLKRVLEKALKVPEISLEQLYEAASSENLEGRLEVALTAKNCDISAEEIIMARSIAWTPAMRRLYALVEACVEHKEPALLVGETGCGKTTVVQILAMIHGQKLRVLNCHQHTETGDFIGGFRPARQGDAPFAWEDGPLIKAMREGDILLVDELSLAEDSVLERLNSVLEPGRAITLPEKGGIDVEELIAHPNFRLIGTMNPGGDFGKKELSPALRNRFTEIWVGGVSSAKEMEEIVSRRLVHSQNMDTIYAHDHAKELALFWEFYQSIAGAGQAKACLQTRDILAWAQFINEVENRKGPNALLGFAAFAHGAYLTLLDGIGLGLGMPEETAKALNRKCVEYLRARIPDTEVRQQSHFFFETSMSISPAFFLLHCAVKFLLYLVSF
jgi:midasin